MKLRVLFVAMRWDYKDPRKGSSFENATFFDSLSRMPEVDAQLFPFDQIERELGRVAMNSQLLQVVRSGSFDLVFFFMYEEEFIPAIIDEITSITTTLNWFADDTWRFHSYSKHWTPHFTYVATTDVGSLPLYGRHGLENVLLTQWACNPYVFKPTNGSRDIDVSFIGQKHGDRHVVIERLRQRGVNVRTWGAGWPDGRLGTDELVDAISRSNVSLNLAGGSKVGNPLNALAFTVRPHNRLLANPRRLADNVRALRARSRPQIKGRTFEVPACRTLLLTSAVEGLERYFDIGREVEVFTDEEELATKCTLLLREADRRETIADAGYRRVLKDHTYERRFTDLFGQLGFDLAGPAL